jgi:DNA-binding response OmpR family regulator
LWHFAAEIRRVVIVPDNRLLIIDDDVRLAEMLTEYLAPEGIELTSVASGIQGLRSAQRENYDLIILDVMLPGLSGFDVLKQLREAGVKTPVLMLTARGDDVDRIVGLDLGADDYLPKPFNPRELVARIHAVLRRRQPPPPPGAPETSAAVISFGAFSLDLGTRTLLNGKDEVPLTTGEFALLKVLATHPRNPLSRDKLMELARGREFGAFDRSIDVQVSRLRRLVETDPSRPAFIQTVWGFGYVFVPDGKGAEAKSETRD